MPSIRKIIKIAAENPGTALLGGLHLLRRLSRAECNLKTGWSLCPDFVTFLITKRCNYKCQRCSAHSPEETKSAGLSFKEITTNDCKKVIDEISFFKPVIYFCGGEPTLRDDLVELIRYIKKKRMFCAMTTNGSLLKERLTRDLVDSGIDFISISLDGDKTVHDKVRGVPGAYEDVVNGIKQLKRFRQNRTIPHIKLVGIINPENPMLSKHVLDIGNELGVDEINFGHLMFYTKEVAVQQAEFVKKRGIGSGYITGMEIRENIKADIKGLQKIISEIKNNKPVHTSIAQGFNLDIEKYYQIPYLYPSLDSRCLTPWFSAIVRPDGNVSACMEFNVGNVKERRFLDIWNDEKWRLFRKLKGGKKEQVPACFRCGEGQRIKFDS